MEPRVSYTQLAPAAGKLGRELGDHVHGGALDTSRLEFVPARTLQRTGCAYGSDAREWADLRVAIVAMNAWNRIGVAIRPLPGSYQQSAEDPSRAEDIGVA